MRTRKPLLVRCFSGSRTQEQLNLQRGDSGILVGYAAGALKVAPALPKCAAQVRPLQLVEATKEPATWPGAQRVKMGSEI